MVTHIFPDFLDSDDMYEAAVSFWEKLVRRLEESAGQEGEWGRWIPTYFADGSTPIDEPGNPIFDGFSQRLDRAFRIIQHEPLLNSIEIEAWLKNYREDRDDPSLLPAEELVIVLSLSEESAAAASRLLDAWMNPKTTLERMEAVIEELGD